MREGVSVGVRVGETDSAALGVWPVVTDWELEAVAEAECDTEAVLVRVCVGDADGGGTVGHALLAPLRRSDGRLLRVQEVGLPQEPAVPAGKVITAEMPPAETVLCQPAAPSIHTSPSALVVPVEVMLSGPTAMTRDPAHGFPSNVTAEMIHVSLGLRSAFHHPAAIAAMSAPVWSRRPLGAIGIGLVHLPLVVLYSNLNRTMHRRYYE